jgi:outer membrane immunogenic protein
MNRSILAMAAFAVALPFASPSLAADMPGRYGEPAYVSPAIGWGGVYVGVNGGYGWGSSDWSGFGIAGSTSPSGPLFGGTLGFNMQAGAWVFGVEGDLDGNWMKSTTSSGAGFCAAPGCTVQTSWFATARARVGYAFGPALFYITGGGAFGDVQMVAAGTASQSRAGWTIGTGLEYAILGPWSAKIEYLYADLGNSTCGPVFCGVSTNVTFKPNIIRLGVNYRFW